MSNFAEDCEQNFLQNFLQNFPVYCRTLFTQTIGDKIYETMS